MIRLINAILGQAVREKASDIHIEPYEEKLSVRFRIDGVLREVLTPKLMLAPLLASRIKVMARMDIAEKRLPQDGRISVKLAGHAIDIRVSTIPSTEGERVVLRLLDKQAEQLQLPQLAMPEGRSPRFSPVSCAASRYYPGNRSHWLGQKYYPLRSAHRTQRHQSQHLNHRGPGRISTARDRPNPGQ